MEGAWLTEGTREELIPFPHMTLGRGPLGGECRPLRDEPRKFLPVLGSQVSPQAFQGQPSAAS